MIFKVHFTARLSIIFFKYVLSSDIQSLISSLLLNFSFFTYRIEETDAQREERLKKWDKFLETGEKS